ncbi:hypothetical protein HDU93_006287 [Gonapodya sp. JEL0774]|nr:hypothetical protein HDU93_006287 [Gonapodya sp. JEL0774]
MQTILSEITESIREFIAKQKIFFVATAPLSAKGHINVSPRSSESFRIVNEHTAYWIDLTGSGAETIAHLKENRRIVVMFAGFEKQPNIVRLWGMGRVVEKGTKEFNEIVAPELQDIPGTRAAIVIDVTQTGSSCGYSVPFFTYTGERSTLKDWTRKFCDNHPEEGITAYHRQKNRFSWDGLVAVEQGMPKDFEYWTKYAAEVWGKWEMGVVGVAIGIAAGNDVPLVGGKNASLGEMFQQLGKITRAIPTATAFSSSCIHNTDAVPLGVKIPNGFAVTGDAYLQALNDVDWRELHRLLDGINKMNKTARQIQAIGDTCRQIVYRACVTPEIHTQILNAYRELCNQYGQEISVAVRSSATAEDLPDASFAGQHDSFLNIKGETQVIEAYRRCCASLFTDRAISYRIDKGFDHFKVRISVGIMKMVRSDAGCAGVMFTLDTESGFKDAVFVTASYGLGENVVQGAIDPDEFFVHKPTFRIGHRAVMMRVLGRKQLTMVYDTSKSAKEPVKNLVTPHRRAQVFCLTDQQVLVLADYAIKIEDYYSKMKGRWMPMDIEWALDGTDNELYIVQARPETSHSQQSGSAFLETYTLMGKGKILVKGRAVGTKISVGKARVITNLKQDIKNFEEGEVLVADNTTPDWEPIMKKAAGIVANRGGRTCHAAIIARELGIPAVIGTEFGTDKIQSGDILTLDCSSGETGSVYEGTVPFKIDRLNLATLKRPKTKIMINLGNPELAFKTAQIPNDGVGLARMEFIINEYIKIHPMALIHPDRVRDVRERRKIEELVRNYPDGPTYMVQRLSEGVATIAGAFWPRDVVVRLSDFKSNEYASLIGGKDLEPVEENPMIGFRGASRYTHAAYEEGFALECTALKRVRDDMGMTNLIVMVPFCRTVKEGQAVVNTMARHGLVRGVNGLKVYVMCEIPNNVILIDEFSKLFDGFSIGSNDLTQLTLGIDRDNGIVAKSFDERDPGMKAMLKMAVEGCKRNKKHSGICGQAPSDYPEIAEYLVKLGIQAMSLTPDSVVKTTIAVRTVEEEMGLHKTESGFEIRSHPRMNSHTTSEQIVEREEHEDGTVKTGDGGFGFQVYGDKNREDGKELDSDTPSITTSSSSATQTLTPESSEDEWDEAEYVEDDALFPGFDLLLAQRRKIGEQNIATNGAMAGDNGAQVGKMRVGTTVAVRDTRSQQKKFQKTTQTLARRLARVKRTRAAWTLAAQELDVAQREVEAWENHMSDLHPRTTDLYLHLRSILNPESPTPSTSDPPPLGTLLSYRPSPAALAPSPVRSAYSLALRNFFCLRDDLARAWSALSHLRATVIPECTAALDVAERSAAELIEEGVSDLIMVPGGDECDSSLISSDGSTDPYKESYLNGDLDDGDDPLGRLAHQLTAMLHRQHALAASRRAALEARQARARDVKEQIQRRAKEVERLRLEKELREKEAKEETARIRAEEAGKRAKAAAVTAISSNVTSSDSRRRPQGGVVSGFSPTITGNKTKSQSRQAREHVLATLAEQARAALSASLPHHSSPSSRLPALSRPSSSNPGNHSNSKAPLPIETPSTAALRAVLDDAKRKKWEREERLRREGERRRLVKNELGAGIQRRTPKRRRHSVEVVKEIRRDEIGQRAEEGGEDRIEFGINSMTSNGGTGGGSSGSDLQSVTDRIQPAPPDQAESAVAGTAATLCLAPNLASATIGVLDAGVATGVLNFPASAPVVPIAGQQQSLSSFPGGDASTDGTLSSAPIVVPESFVPTPRLSRPESRPITQLQKGKDSQGPEGDLPPHSRTPPARSTPGSAGIQDSMKVPMVPPDLNRTSATGTITIATITVPPPLAAHRMPPLPAILSTSTGSQRSTAFIASPPKVVFLDYPPPIFSSGLSADVSTSATSKQLDRSPVESRLTLTNTSRVTLGIRPLGPECPSNALVEGPLFEARISHPRRIPPGGSVVARVLFYPARVADVREDIETGPVYEDLRGAVRFMVEDGAIFEVEVEAKARRCEPVIARLGGKPAIVKEVVQDGESEVEKLAARLGIERLAELDGGTVTYGGADEQTRVVKVDIENMGFLGGTWRVDALTSDLTDGTIEEYSHTPAPLSTVELLSVRAVPVEGKVTGRGLGVGPGGASFTVRIVFATSNMDAIGEQIWEPRFATRLMVLRFDSSPVFPSPVPITMDRAHSVLLRCTVRLVPPLLRVNPCMVNVGTIVVGRRYERTVDVIGGGSKAVPFEVKVVGARSMVGKESKDSGRKERKRESEGTVGPILVRGIGEVFVDPWAGYAQGRGLGHLDAGITSQLRIRIVPTRDEFLHAIKTVPRTVSTPNASPPPVPLCVPFELRVLLVHQRAHSARISIKGFLTCGDVDVDTCSLSFPVTTIGGENRARLTLRNRAVVAQRVQIGCQQDAVVVEGLDDGGGLLFGGGEDRGVEIVFRPHKVGLVNGILTVKSELDGGGEVAINGMGRMAGAEFLEGMVEFGGTAVGGKRKVDVRIKGADVGRQAKRTLRKARGGEVSETDRRKDKLRVEDEAPMIVFDPSDPQGFARMADIPGWTFEFGTPICCGIMVRKPDGGETFLELAEHAERETLSKNGKDPKVTLTNELVKVIPGKGFVQEGETCILQAIFEPQFNPVTGAYPGLHFEGLEEIGLENLVSTHHAEAPPELDTPSLTEEIPVSKSAKSGTGKSTFELPSTGQSKHGTHRKGDGGSKLALSEIKPPVDPAAEAEYRKDIEQEEIYERMRQMKEIALDLKVPCLVRRWPLSAQGSIRDGSRPPYIADEDTIYLQVIAPILRPKVHIIDPDGGTVDFVPTPIGEQLTKNVIVRNISDDPVLLKLESISPPQVFHVLAAPIEVPAQREGPITIRFAPDSMHRFKSTALLTDGSFTNIPLIIRGRGFVPKVSFDPDAQMLDIGTVLLTDIPIPRTMFSFVNECDFIVSFKSSVECKVVFEHVQSAFRCEASTGIVAPGSKSPVNIIFDPPMEVSGLCGRLRIQTFGVQEDYSRPVVARSSATSLYITGYDTDTQFSGCEIHPWRQELADLLNSLGGYRPPSGSKHKPTESLTDQTNTIDAEKLKTLDLQQLPADVDFGSFKVPLFRLLKSYNRIRCEKYTMKWQKAEMGEFGWQEGKAWRLEIKDILIVNARPNSNPSSSMPIAIGGGGQVKGGPPVKTGKGVPNYPGEFTVERFHGTIERGMDGRWLPVPSDESTHQTSSEIGLSTKGWAFKLDETKGTVDYGAVKRLAITIVNETSDQTGNVGKLPAPSSAGVKRSISSVNSASKKGAGDITLKAQDGVTGGANTIAADVRQHWAASPERIVSCFRLMLRGGLNVLEGKGLGRKIAPEMDAELFERAKAVSEEDHTVRIWYIQVIAEM